MFKSQTANELDPIVEEVFDFFEAGDLEGLNRRLAEVRDNITQVHMHSVAMYLRASYSYQKLLADWESLLITAIQESIKNSYPVTDLFYGLWKVDKPLHRDLFKGTQWEQSIPGPDAQD